MTKVAIARDNNVEYAIEDALHRLDLRSLIAGKLVAVKPNETWASPTDCRGLHSPIRCELSCALSRDTHQGNSWSQVGQERQNRTTSFASLDSWPSSKRKALVFLITIEARSSPWTSTMAAMPRWWAYRHR